MIQGGGYPLFLQRLLDSCPARPDRGVHLWLFRVARYLHRYHSPAEIQKILEDKSSGCGRYLEPHEIPDAIRNSGTCQREPNPKTISERRAEWLKNPTIRKVVPEFNPKLAIETAAHTPIDVTPEWLKQRSPVTVSCSTHEFLKTLFRPDEKAVIFNVYKSQGVLGRIKSTQTIGQQSIGRMEFGFFVIRWMEISISILECVTIARGARNR